jgi:hypothetical protein
MREEDEVVPKEVLLVSDDFDLASLTRNDRELSCKIRNSKTKSESYAPVLLF